MANITAIEQLASRVKDTQSFDRKTHELAFEDTTYPYIHTMNFLSRIELKGMKFPLDPAWSFTYRHRRLVFTAPVQVTADSAYMETKIKMAGEVVDMPDLWFMSTTVELNPAALLNPPTHIVLHGGMYPVDLWQLLFKVVEENPEVFTSSSQPPASGMEEKGKKDELVSSLMEAKKDLDEIEDYHAVLSVGKVVEGIVPLAKDCCETFGMKIPHIDDLDWVSHVSFRGMRLPLDPEWEIHIGFPQHKFFMASSPDDKATMSVDGICGGVITMKANMWFHVSEAVKKNPPTSVHIRGGIYHRLHRRIFYKMEEAQKEKALGVAACIMERETLKVFNKLSAKPQPKAVEIMVELPLTKGREDCLRELTCADYIYHIEYKGMRQPLAPGWKFSTHGYNHDHILVEDPSNPARRSGINNTGLLNKSLKWDSVFFSEEAKKNLPTSVTLGLGYLCRDWRLKLTNLQGAGQLCYSRGSHPIPYTFDFELEQARSHLASDLTLKDIELEATYPIELSGNVVRMPKGLDYICSIEPLGMEEPLSPGWSYDFLRGTASFAFKPDPQSPLRKQTANHHGLVLINQPLMGDLILNDQAMKNPPKAIRVKGGLIQEGGVRKVLSDPSINLCIMHYRSVIDSHSEN